VEPIKIVVRFTDGRIRKGYSQDFSPNKPIFRLVKDRTGAGEVEEINLADLKAVFFVKTFTGNPDHKERNRFTKGDIPKGRKVEVTFADGEVLRGTVMGYNQKDPGFFFFPADPQSNNLRAFVVSAAVKTFRYLGSDSSPKTDKNDYQCLIPETGGKLLMVSGEERKVLKLILAGVLETDSGREYIIEKLGEVYLRLAEELLEEMERG
jgi:hypothetical protein